MALFIACLQEQNSENVVDNLKQHNISFYHLKPNTAYMINYAGTSQELAEKLNIVEGGNTGVILGLNAAHFGYASPAVWEWLKINIT